MAGKRAWQNVLSRSGLDRLQSIKAILAAQGLEQCAMNTHRLKLMSTDSALSPHSCIVSCSKRTTKSQSNNYVCYERKFVCVCHLLCPPPPRSASAAAQPHRQLPLVAGENRDAAAPLLATAMAAASARDTCSTKHRAYRPLALHVGKCAARRQSQSWQGLFDW